MATRSSAFVNRTNASSIGLQAQGPPRDSNFVSCLACPTAGLMQNQSKETANTEMQNQGKETANTENWRQKENNKAVQQGLAGAMLSRILGKTTTA